jgi:hypothetical protein
MAVEENQAKHALVSSWFLGPRAENFDVLNNLFQKVLSDQAAARKTLSAGDPIFITPEMKELDVYKNSIETLAKGVNDLSFDLATHTVPFWSPRYNAHMNMDTALSSIIGCTLSSGTCDRPP